MTRYPVKLIILMLSMLLPISGGLAGTREANKFTLLYSNNVNGETEPCG
ncbi:MAG: hypothetical protein ABFQ82_01490 [Thermodesulfobacteriota bacterium]